MKTIECNNRKIGLNEGNVLKDVVENVENKEPFSEAVYDPNWKGPTAKFYRGRDGKHLYENQFDIHKSLKLDSTLEKYLSKKGFKKVESPSFINDLFGTWSENLKKNPTYTGQDSHGDKHVFRINKQEHAPFYFDFRKIKSSKLEKILPRLDPIRTFIDNRIYGAFLGIPFGLYNSLINHPGELGKNILIGGIIGQLMATIYSDIRDLLNWKFIEMPDKENKPITKLLSKFSYNKKDKTRQENKYINTFVRGPKPLAVKHK